MQKAVFIANMAFGFNVELHQPKIGFFPEGHTTARPHAVVHVDGVGVGLGGTPAFKNFKVTEALNPLLPNFRGQTGTHHFSQAVFFVVGLGWHSQQKATDLSHILANRDLVLTHI